MPATHDRRVFGPKGQPGVEVPLPAIITAGISFFGKVGGCLGIANGME